MCILSLGTQCSSMSCSFWKSSWTIILWEKSENSPKIYRKASRIIHGGSFFPFSFTNIRSTSRRPIPQWNVMTILHQNNLIRPAINGVKGSMSSFQKIFTSCWICTSFGFSLTIFEKSVNNHENDLYQTLFTRMLSYDSSLRISSFWAQMSIVCHSFARASTRYILYDPTPVHLSCWFDRDGYGEINVICICWWTKRASNKL